MCAPWPECRVWILLDPWEHGELGRLPCQKKPVKAHGELRGALCHLRES